MSKHPYPKPLQEWFGIIRESMPHLSKPQAKVLAMWSFSVVMTKTVGLSTNANFLASYLKEKENTVRQRLREWYWDSAQKKGKDRKMIDVEKSFQPLLKWILTLWDSQDKRIALAMDATTLREVFIVLSINVVYRGSAIPVAWKIIEANESGSWKPHWQRLFSLLQGAIPEDWLVIVTADRGLYAPWLYEEIVQIGWHPFLRINAQGAFRPKGTDTWQELNQLITEVEQYWSGQVTCFKGNPVEGTLLAHWEAKYEDPWLILTDLPPDQADIAWYSRRFWIECGYKDFKRDGWQWQKTGVRTPERAERMWLVMAVSMLWALSVGGDEESAFGLRETDSLTDQAQVQTGHSHINRIISCFVRGINTIFATLLRGESLPLGRFIPLPWPVSHDFTFT